MVSEHHIDMNDHMKSLPGNNDSNVSSGCHDSSMSAVQRVFNTNELMEMILAFLPLPSLLRVQAVNKQWRGLIKDSTQLQQQLFFKPEKSNKVWLAEITNLPSQQHPLPRRFKSSIRVIAQVPQRHEALNNYHGLIATPVTANPLFLHNARGPETVDQKVDGGFVAEYSLDESFLRTISQHSLRDMLLTQPPVRKLFAEVMVQRQPGEASPIMLTLDGSEEVCVYSTTVLEPHGIRLHHIASELRKIGMLSREGSIRLFMRGVVEWQEGDMQEIRKRTKAWQTARDAQLNE